MMTRRALLAASAATALLFAAGLPAFAQDADSGFVQGFGTRVIGVINGPGDLAAKQAAIRPMVDQAVDVRGIAMFCLGRFARTATPAQLAEFERLFHGVLVNNVTAKVGEFKGVTFTMTNTTRRGDESLVGTVVTRPNNAPTNVQWVVSNSSGAPKIVDVVAEGTSLRLTQRSDYNSFLSTHGDNLDALIAAMKRQVGG